LPWWQEKAEKTAMWIVSSTQLKAGLGTVFSPENRSDFHLEFAYATQELWAIHLKVLPKEKQFALLVKKTAR
jgi:hypothetical protein